MNKMNATPTLRDKEARKFIRQEIANRKKCAPKKEVREAVKIFCRILANNEEAIKQLANDFLK